MRSKIGSNINTSSPPATPTLSEPMEKRIRSDTSENFTNGDDDTQSGYAETNKSGVMHHGQSINSIISMEDDDFASDDEKVQGSEIVIIVTAVCTRHTSFLF